MSEQFKITDAELKTAGECLVAASYAMEVFEKKAPGQFASLTGIGETVQQFLKSLEEARFALADAAKTGAQEVAGVMQVSKSLDQHIANSLQSGFLVSGSKKK
ncbi:hypothetical protein G7067_04970 [Leucobacter insecticola]|uniref:Uncharacterized protein n=1 Tax=Leucobacter insecticola TaxID=2714934 RepID=A0A6G8FHE0_9MICO|nr:hypothetical protein [Leucobacter insecticola]QIM15916.1 hypothetical protein G7067_04970 [Leucobacter insecticola]